MKPASVLLAPTVALATLCGPTGAAGPPPDPARQQAEELAEEASKKFGELLKGELGQSVPPAPPNMSQGRRDPPMTLIFYWLDYADHQYHGIIRRLASDGARESWIAEVASGNWLRRSQQRFQSLMQRLASPAGPPPPLLSPAPAPAGSDRPMPPAAPAVIAEEPRGAPDAPDPRPQEMTPAPATPPPPRPAPPPAAVAAAVPAPTNLDTAAAPPPSTPSLADPPVQPGSQSEPKPEPTGRALDSETLASAPARPEAPAPPASPPRVATSVPE